MPRVGPQTGVLAPLLPLLCAFSLLVACDKSEPARDAGSVVDTQPDTELDLVVGTDVVLPDLGGADAELTCPGAAGCSCAADGDCVSGLCVETPSGRQCATLCTSDCPEGFLCRSAPLGGDPVSYCAPVGVRQCAPCNTKADCNTQWSIAAECIDAGTAGSFCATSCNVQSDCPAAMQCVDVAGVGKVCQPGGGVAACTCSAWATAQGASTACDVLEGTQACPGSRTCGPDGLTDCTKLDGEPCADAGCKDAKDGSGCDDGDPCTQSECKSGVCTATANLCQCQQNSDCTDDGNLCNGTPFCDKTSVPYTCKNNPATVVTCEASGKPCTTPVCVPATGQCTDAPAADGQTCNDGDPCFANRTCLGGQCQGGIQTCACLQTSDCTALENNNLCDGTLYCDLLSHTCKVNPATVVQCPAPSGSCSKVTCQPDSGQCNEVALPEASPCEDGAVCTVGDYCSAGKCVAGTVTCSCSADADCAPYEDGDACNGLLFCNKAVGKCQVNPKTVVQCPTVNDTECRTNTCEPQTGACALAFAPTTTLCEDGNPCTASDHCQEGECTSNLDICPCDVDADCADKEDGNQCNGTLYCDLLTHTCEVNPASVVTCPFAGSNPCAPIQCNPATGTCEANPVLAGACDDGDACTAMGSCVAGVCKAGPNVCQCKTSSDCVPYDDGNPCNGTLYCDVQAGLCKPNLASIPVCPPSGDPCSQNSCDPATGGCTVQAAKDGTWCSDGQACTKGDACVSGACKAGALVCDCLTTADCAGKEDGNLCNGTLICDTSGLAPACVLNPASVVVCADDGAACTDPVCTPATGACTKVPVNGVCSDGDACTSGDACADGACVPGAALPCNDNNPCTNDSCNPGSGCVFLPNNQACDDNNACTTIDTCNGGSCVGSSPVVCAAKDSCHDAGVCDPSSGVCSEPAKADGATCDDGNKCTQNDACKSGACESGPTLDCTALGQCYEAGSCNPATGACSNPQKTTGTACDDGNGCTINDACVAGTCFSNTPKVCTAQDQCHDVGSCNPADGTCSNPAKVDGTGCTDGDACTQTDTCQSGSCVGASPVVCTALDQCHDAGTCNTATGVCSNPAKSDGTGCSDGDACTQTDSCQAGSCVGASPVSCTAQDQCHDPGTCNPGTGICSNPAKANGAGCTDGNACTQTDTCQAGTCTGSNPVVCTALDQCHSVGTCNTADGKCSQPNVADLTACSDGSACSEADVCQSGVCTPGPAPNCDDTNPCTTDSCDPASGCKHTANTLSCSDGSECTKLDTCSGGSCVGVPVVCNDANRYTVDSCDPASGCKHLAAEICNGADDDGDGLADNVMCGSKPCTCDNGVTRCQAGCTTCPDPDDIAMAVDDAGTARVICAPTWPRWGIQASAPVGLTVPGNGTVIDTTTGLQWEQAVGASVYTWAGASGYCNGLTLAGLNDWRLPTTAELSSLTNLGATTAPVVPTYEFPNTPSGIFWTAETLRSAGVQAWTVSSTDGSQVSYDIAATNFGKARCVRSVSSVPRPSLRWQVEALGDVVHDLRTGLQWQRSPSNTAGPNLNGLFSHSMATMTCDALVLGGHDDWRLPTLREAQSILDLQKTSAPAYDQNAFPTQPAGTWGYVWTSTYVGGSASSAWVVEFGSSGATSPRSTSDANAIRCVRIPQCGDGTCEPGEDMRCAIDCGCHPSLAFQACNDGNACTVGETCQNNVCTGTTATACWDGWQGSTDGCDSAKGCTFAWPEVCNGKDDNLDGTTDNVQCSDQPCTCDGGVTTCESTCTDCPNPDDVAIPITTAAGSKVVCAHDYPAWGIVADKPATLLDAGNGTVADSRTGLVWQQVAGATAVTRADAVTACDNATLGGFDDWRLPTLAELSSLLNLEPSSATVYLSTLFPSTSLNAYWTATRQGVGSNWMTLSFNAADIDSQTAISYTPLVRCVRSASSPPVPAQRWVRSSSSSSVRDTVTGVHWQTSPPLTGGDGTGKFDYANAVDYCGLLSMDGYDDWRLPTLREMLSILRLRNATAPYADTEALSGLPTSGGQNYWTSTPYFATGSSMWLVDTSSGHTSQGVPSNLFRPLCVRVPICGDGRCEDPEKSTCVADCGCTPQLEGAACNDGLPCTAGDKCQEGSCIATGPTNCDDGNPCTSETCIGASGCSYTPVSNPCDDGSLCTTDDSCSAGTCVGVMLNCDDGWPESADSCNPTLGKCEHSWPETCNGADDNLDGQVDNVTCAGGGSCTCTNGVTICPASCSTCPDSRFRAISINDGANKVLCAPEYPIWGVLPDTPSAITDGGDGTLIDAATGLEWEKVVAGSGTWSSARAYCDGLTLAGKVDWRAPTVVELLSIVDLAKGTAPPVATTLFPGTSTVMYWTASTYATGTGAWTVRFDDGSSMEEPLGNSHPIRCVRSNFGTGRNPRRWVISGSTQVATDMMTGLTWQRYPRTSGGSSGNGVDTPAGAQQYCADLVLDGRDDWRLPKLRELQTVIDGLKPSSPVVDTVVFPNLTIAAPGHNYHSATIFAQNGTSFWDVDMTGGNSSPNSSTSPGRSICVRDPTCGDATCTAGESLSCPSDCF